MKNLANRHAWSERLCLQSSRSQHSTPGVLSSERLITDCVRCGQCTTVGWGLSNITSDRTVFFLFLLLFVSSIPPSLPFLLVLVSFAGPIQHNNNKELFLDSRVESEAQEIEKERQPERRQEPLNDRKKGVSAQEPGNTLHCLCCA